MSEAVEVAAEPEAQAPEEAKPKHVWAEDAPWPERRLLAVRIGKLGLWAVGVGALLFTKVPVCPVAILSGHPCPGCGLTRATLACVQGHFAEAYHLHPLVFVATPAAAITVGLGVYSYLKIGRTRFSPTVMKWISRPLQVLYVVMMALWIARFFGAFGGPVEVTHSIFSLGQLFH